MERSWGTFLFFFRDRAAQKASQTPFFWDLFTVLFVLRCSLSWRSCVEAQRGFFLDDCGCGENQQASVHCAHQPQPNPTSQWLYNKSNNDNNNNNSTNDNNE
jgi:hypothetical protein